MIIDFHTHTFPDAMADKTIAYLAEKSDSVPKSDGKISGLLHCMEESGTDLSIILPIVTKPSQFDTINRVAYETNETYFKDGKGLLSFGSLFPASVNYMDELRIIKDYGFKGIKLHPDYQQTFIDDPVCEKIIYRASELGLIISIHAGFDPGWPELTHATPDRILHMLHDVAPEKFVLAHMGACLMWDEAEEKLMGQNVYLDTAYCAPNMPTKQMKRMIAAHGADRILFATDSPWVSQTDSIRYIQSLGLTEEQTSQILYKNAQRLLGFSVK